MATDDSAREREAAALAAGWLCDDRSLQHDVYAVIVDWIHQGTLRPGDRISEAAIARRLGISRGPVREARTRLDNEGLVIRRPRRGPIVANLTAKDLDDIVAIRQLVEGYAVRRACQQLTPANLTELERLIEAMEAAALAGRWTETASLNARFHQTVVQIAGNSLLTKIWHSLHPLAWLLAPTVSPNRPHDVASLLTRHRGLLDALAAGDPDRAEASFRAHIQQAADSTRAAISEAPARHGARDGRPEPVPTPADQRPALAALS